MENETALIREQMLETRTALTEKLETLEEQVAGRIKDTTESVAETVATVKEAVENTVHTVSDSVERTVESVKETFDFNRQFQEHPWLILGGAVVAGYIGARLLDRLAPPVSTNGVSHEHTPQPRSPVYQAAAAPPNGHSYGGDMVQAMKPALSKLGELAIGVTTGLIADLVREQVPEALKQDVTEAMDDFTRALGGKPLHGFLPKESAEVDSTTRQVP